MPKEPDLNFWLNDFDFVKHATISKWRQDFLAQRIVKLEAKSILEIGCSTGENLVAVHNLDPTIMLYGVDASDKAILYGQKNFKYLNLCIEDICSANAFDAFGDESMDLVFTSGTLLYQSEKTMDAIIEQIYRIARNYIIHVECHERGKCRRHQLHKNTLQMFVHDYVKHYSKFIDPSHITIQRLKKCEIVKEFPSIDLKKFRNLGEAKTFIQIDKLLKNDNTGVMP